MQLALAERYRFLLNGEWVEVAGVSPDTTLLSWLRQSGRCGTKCGCNEGDCGACTVALRDGGGEWRAINSCLILLPMLADREVLTVEGLEGAGLHPVQQCMIRHYGSQCGYCTPGFVMSLFEGYHRKDCQDEAKIADQLAGNLCRCTGYRPIRDAALAVFAEKTEDSFTRRPEARARPASELFYRNDAECFLRPSSLAQLFALRGEFPEAPVVAGATEIAVLANKRYLRYPQLISLEAVEELRRIEKGGQGWRLGAAATLTEIEEAIEGELPSVEKMLRVFASRQIRSRATLGGNLATASPIGDSAPVLLALDASLILASEEGERSVPISQFFLGYRKTVLRSGEVIKCIVIPHAPARRVEFYKVSKRLEMDISTVSAAFAIEEDAAGRVKYARMAFGGVAVTAARVLQAEDRLVGRTLAEARAEVAEILSLSFTPIDDVRGSAAFRRALVVSLWEKFVTAEEESPTHFVPGRQWETKDDSRALSHESAVGHVTGRAEYVDDVAQKRPMLEVWPVCAPHARARILRRDATRARRAPGVRAVLLAEDVPGENDVGVSRKDEVLLADKEVFFHGQIVAVIVGESLNACRAAAALVEVEYEPLSAVLTIVEAIAANSFHTEANTWRRGDCDVALQRCAHSLEGSLEIQGQEHFYLETHACTAEMDGDGNILVSSSTQHPSEIQTIVADVLHLSRNRVVVQAPRMGGGFGGKETQGNTWAAIVALAAMKTRKPVRMQLDRDLDMQLTGKRHPFRANFVAGYDSEGRLLALKCDLISNGGWSLDLSMPITDRAMFHIDNAYYIPNLAVSGRVAKTNITSNTAFRGFGGPQGMVVIEEILARIAGRLGLPPETVRERNLYHGSGETNTTHYGEEIGDNRLQAIWRQLLERSDFHGRRREIAAANAKRIGIKRGLAITPVKFGISFTYTPYNQAGGLVLIYRDGTVQVNHGGTEMGQGLHTKIKGVVMRDLGVRQEDVRIMTTATDKVPNTSATAASSGSDLNGAAVRNACLELVKRLTPCALELLEREHGVSATGESLIFERGAVFVRGDNEKAVAFREVVELAYMQRVSLSATGYYATPGLNWDRIAGKGRPFHYFACGAAVTEVQVDGYTGAAKILRVDILHDAGQSLNPGIDRGQIEGGFVQGAGWLTSEDLRWSRDGLLLSHSASTYQIPAFSDAPADFRVALFENAEQPNVIHGSKAVGEPPLMLAISVREAIRDAVGAFGSSGREIHIGCPCTPEAIFTAIQNARRVEGGSPQ